MEVNYPKNIKMQAVIGSGKHHEFWAKFTEGWIIADHPGS